MAGSADWTEGITDNVSIRKALAFTESWHTSEWCIATLPALLAAPVQMGPAGPFDLGAAITRRDGARGIGLNEELLGTRGYIPILAHECGHLFQPPGMLGFCRTASKFRQSEREAWWIASVLAVPLEAVGDVALFGDAGGIVASQLNLPKPMILMRKGVALLMGELPVSPRDHARLLLETASIAMQMWIYRFSEQLAQRPKP